jgi:hypothetical protein
MNSSRARASQIKYNPMRLHLRCTCVARFLFCTTCLLVDFVTCKPIRKLVYAHLHVHTRQLDATYSKAVGIVGHAMKGQLQLHGMMAGQLEMGADEMAWYGMAYEGLQSYCTWHIAVV